MPIYNKHVYKALCTCIHNKYFFVESYQKLLEGIEGD